MNSVYENIIKGLFPEEKKVVITSDKIKTYRLNFNGVIPSLTIIDLKEGEGDEVANNFLKKILNAKTDIVCDCSNLDTLGDSTLRAVLKGLARLKQKNKKLILLNVNDELRGYLEKLCLDEVLLVGRKSSK